MCAHTRIHTTVGLPLYSGRVSWCSRLIDERDVFGQLVLSLQFVTTVWTERKRYVTRAAMASSLQLVTTLSVETERYVEGHLASSM